MEEDRSDEHPYFHILQGFNHLILLVMRILDSSLVRLEPLDGDDLFTLIEELCGVRRIGQDPPKSTSKADRNKSELEMRQCYWGISVSINSQ